MPVTFKVLTVPKLPVSIYNSIAPWESVLLELYDLALCSPKDTRVCVIQRRWSRFKSMDCKSCWTAPRVLKQSVRCQHFTGKNLVERRAARRRGGRTTPMAKFTDESLHSNHPLRNYTEIAFDCGNAPVRRRDVGFTWVGRKSQLTDRFRGEIGTGTVFERSHHISRCGGMPTDLAELKRTRRSPPQPLHLSLLFVPPPRPPPSLSPSRSAFYAERHARRRGEKQSVLRVGGDFLVKLHLH